MKSHVVFLIKVVTAFLASFFVPLRFGKHDDGQGDALADFKSLVGKKAIVTECVTVDAGKVRVSGADWRALISKECSATSLEPDTEVTIKKLEGSVLHVC